VHAAKSGYCTGASYYDFEDESDLGSIGWQLKYFLYFPLLGDSVANQQQAKNIGACCKAAQKIQGKIWKFVQTEIFYSCTITKRRLPKSFCILSPKCAKGFYNSNKQQVSVLHSVEQCAWKLRPVRS
jgi:hypothetical protein